MSDSPPHASADADARPATFTPVRSRARYDGWTPLRQVAFVQALAESGCVTEAAQRVGLSASSAYRLRRRGDAGSFRQAWDLALEYAINRLADAALGRALNGVATPVFYKGEQIGERRRYDEKLTMFLLRYRRPDRYGVWLDSMKARERHPDGPAIRMTEAMRRLSVDLAADRARRPRQPWVPLEVEFDSDDPEQVAAMEEAKEAREKAKRDAEWEGYLATLGAEYPDPALDGDDGDNDDGDDEDENENENGFDDQEDGEDDDFGADVP